MSEAECRSILTRALDADEAGHKELAIELYGQAVETILRIEDREKRDKLNKFALQALGRAEELKGIKYVPPTDLKIPGTTTTHPVRSSTAVGGSPLPSPRLEVSGARTAYTSDEKKVLEHTSHINSKVYVPFMDIDLMRKFIFPIPFTDKDGYLELAPKQKRDFV